jgi:hypothetical protein
LGVPQPEIEEVERQYRQNDEQRLTVQSEQGTLMAAKELMFRPGRRMHLIARNSPRPVEPSFQKSLPPQRIRAGALYAL